MDNFQYSVQLSEQDWAEFSATTDECGLLQADLASGDELLSSDIDQGDSSGSSPPGPPPLLTGQLASRGRGSWGRKEDTAAQQLASRLRCEPVLAPGARQQEAGTSTEPEALPSPSLGAAPVSQCSFLPDSAASRGEMQRLLQGPASSPAGDASGSPDSPGCGGPSQKLPDSPEVSRRSPGRKKRRGVGAKGGQRAGVPGPSAAQSLTREARLEEALVAGTAKLTAQALKDKPDPADSAGALEPGSRPSEEVARQGLCLDLSRPVPTTAQGTDQITPAPRAELHTVSTSVQEICPDVSKAKPDVALSTPVFKPQPDTALSTPATKLQPDMASVSTCKPPPDTILSSPTCKLQPNLALCIPACKPDVTFSTPATNPQLDNASSTPANKPQPNNGLSTSASEADILISTPASTPQCDRAMSVSASPHRLHGDSPVAGPGVKPEGDLITPDSVAELQDVLPYSSAKAVSEVGVSIPAAPSSIPVSWTEPAPADTEVSVLQGGSQEKPGREPLAGAPGHSTGEGPQGPVQATKKKKVRFSMALPSPEEPGLGEATGSPSSATPHSRAPQTRGRSSTWDAVAVGPRAPQPRILKHLPPPPATASSVGPEPGSRFEVTLPEAYEFFFCDTIEEEDEAVEDEAVDSQALDEIQWPDTCEFFFRDFRAQRSRRQGHSAPRAPARAEQEATRPPGDLVPISIPEAYEHLFGEDRLEDTSATLLQLRTSEPLKEGALGLPPEPDPATAEQFSLAVRQADELRGPFTSFTFSQNDMCLVFVAFATWAVRTSDLHTPDAWKTVLLANIGTISAIRYFRQQVRRGRSPSRNSSPSGSPSSSASC